MASRGGIVRIIKRRLKTYTLTIYAWWIAYIPSEILNITLALASWYYYTVFATKGTAEKYVGGVFSYIIVGLMLIPFFNLAIEGPERTLRGLHQGYTYLGGFKIPRWAYYYLAGVSKADAFIGTFIFEFLVFIVRLFIYLGIGSTIFGFSLSGNPDIIAALVFALAGFIACLGLGLLVANTFWLFIYNPEVVVNPYTWILTSLPSIIGGVYFPLEVLPQPLRLLSYALPHYYAFTGIRGALLGGKNLYELLPILYPLLIYVLVVFPLGLAVFRYVEKYMLYKARKI